MQLTNSVVWRERDPFLKTHLAAQFRQKWVPKGLPAKLQFARWRPAKFLPPPPRKDFFPYIRSDSFLGMNKRPPTQQIVLWPPPKKPPKRLSSGPINRVERAQLHLRDLALKEDRFMRYGLGQFRFSQRPFLIRVKKKKYSTGQIVTAWLSTWQSSVLPSDIYINGTPSPLISVHESPRSSSTRGPRKVLPSKALTTKASIPFLTRASCGMRSVWETTRRRSCSEWVFSPELLAQTFGVSDEWAFLSLREKDESPVSGRAD